MIHKPSVTSIWAAAARAIGAREPDAAVRNPDWFAEKLLGSEARAVRETLQWIALNAAPESTVVLDYATSAFIQMMGNVDLEKLPEIARQAVIRFRRLTAGEPWIFGLSDKGEPEFLSGLGLELRKVMGLNSTEAVEKYLTRADGSIFVLFPAMEQQGYLILEAAVPLPE